MIPTAVTTPPTEILDLWFGRARHGGYIALGSRRPLSGDPKPVPHFFNVIPIGQQQLYYPGFISHLMDQAQTGYIGTNTLHRKALHAYQRERVPIAPDTYTSALERGKAKYFHFSNDHVRELTCVCADLDPYRDGDITAADAVGTVVSRALYGHIPHPSMVAYSGRGAYALWLLRQQSNMAPPLYTERNAHRWRLITDELLGKLKDLQADGNATRAAQWVKSPATTDTATGETVVYLPFFVQSEGSSKPTVPLYSLTNLVKELDIVTADDLDEGTQTPGLVPYHIDRRPFATVGGTWSRPTSGRGKNAAAPLVARVRDLEALAVHRRKFHGPSLGRKGERYKVCRYYYNALWGAHAIAGHPASYTIARDKLQEFNRRWCTPPLDHSELRKILKAKYRERSRSDTVVRDLGVTVEEAETLDLRQLVPKEVRQSRKAAQQDRGRDKRDRRTQIDAMITAGLPNKEIYKRVPPSYRYTVCRRRKKLGVPNPKGDSRQLHLGGKA